jgi:hypothetical protein
VLANLAVLVAIVRRVAPIEQRALLGGTTAWRWGTRSMLAVAALLSLSVKAWSSPDVGLLAAGLAGTLAVWRLALADRPRRLFPRPRQGPRDLV